MSERNSYSNYIQYLKIKNNTNVCAPTARYYDTQYNKALGLKISDPAAARAILVDLLEIKKDPDVVALSQELGC